MTGVRVFQGYWAVTLRSGVYSGEYIDDLIEIDGEFCPRPEMENVDIVAKCNGPIDALIEASKLNGKEIEIPSPDRSKSSCINIEISVNEG